ncbi:MAG: glutathione S-transferase family protein [Myxococcales bacterium]|nr:glutathione S-transferase family protein [Myxococcales bacterium]
MNPRTEIAALFPATLYDFLSSGNGYKVRLALAHLQLPYRYEEVDLVRGESRTSEFLARNPVGKIPVLVLADGTVLCESNAILWWLCEDSDWMPEGRLARQRVLQWMSFEQYNHEPTVAVLRARALHPEFGTLSEAQRTDLLKRGHLALDVMEQTLSRRPFLVEDQLSIADVALYAYTHVAHQGGYDLHRYSGIRAWLARCRQGLPALRIDETPA